MILNIILNLTCGHLITEMQRRLKIFPQGEKKSLQKFGF